MTQTYEDFLKNAETKEMFYSAAIIKGEASCSDNIPKYNIYSWGRDLLERCSDLSEDQVCYIIKNIKRTAAGYMSGPTELDINHLPVVANRTITFHTIEELVEFDFSKMHLYKISLQDGRFVVRYALSFAE